MIKMVSRCHLGKLARLEDGAQVLKSWRRWIGAEGISHRRSSSRIDWGFEGKTLGKTPVAFTSPFPISGEDETIIRRNFKTPLTIHKSQTAPPLFPLIQKKNTAANVCWDNGRKKRDEKVKIIFALKMIFQKKFYTNNRQLFLLWFLQKFYHRFSRSSILLRRKYYIFVPISLHCFPRRFTLKVRSQGWLACHHLLSDDVVERRSARLNVTYKLRHES